MIAPIDAGIVITTSRLIAMTVSVNSGNLSSANRTNDTTRAARIYAIAIRQRKTGTRYLMLP